MIRLLLVDDHEIITDGIASLLEEEEHIHIVGKCSSGPDALEHIPSLKPDVVITDIEMGEINGIELTRIIRKEYPNISIIILSMYDDSIKIQKSIEAGAMGYILKNTGKKELLKAIQNVFRGETYFSNEVNNSLVKGMVQQNKTDTDNPFERLTKREMELTKLIAQEFTNPEIAEKMYISEFTVKTHRRNIIKKLDVKSTVGLVKLALKHQILSE